MYVQDLGMGVLKATGVPHRDLRGSLTEVFRSDEIQGIHGVVSRWNQVNLSVNNRGVFRGIHFSTASEGQAKYVTCVSGALYDFAVDLRQDSQTFGEALTVPLNVGESVYIPHGFGHGFVTVTDNTVATYLMSSLHNPDREHTVSPSGMFDPLGCAQSHGWTLPLVVSSRDAQAPTLKDHMIFDGPLPRYHGVL